MKTVKGGPISGAQIYQNFVTFCLSKIRIIDVLALLSVSPYSENTLSYNKTTDSQLSVISLNYYRNGLSTSME